MVLCVRMRSRFNKLAGECIKVESQHGVSRGSCPFTANTIIMSPWMYIHIYERAALPFGAGAERGPLRNVFGSLLIATLPAFPPTSITLAIDELEPIQRMLRTRSQKLCFVFRRGPLRDGETLFISCSHLSPDPTQWFCAAAAGAFPPENAKQSAFFARSSGNKQSVRANCLQEGVKRHLWD
jgi:hypothetical protein